MAYERNKHLTQNLLLFVGRRKNMDKPHTKSSFALVLCENVKVNRCTASIAHVMMLFFNLKKGMQRF